jgi:hypothetical protein
LDWLFGASLGYEVDSVPIFDKDIAMALIESIIE